MKKVMMVLILVFSLIFIKFSVSYFVNNKIINDYNEGNYDQNLIKILYFLNLSEPYIVYYNHGNLNYQLKNFSQAIDQYQKSLELKPPVRRVCQVRINLALSYLGKFDENNPDLNLLNTAKNVLYEDECATEDGDEGKSEEAENLEEEIKKLEEKFKDSNNDESNASNKEEDNNDTPSKNYEEELKKRQQESLEQRTDDLNYSKEADNYTYYDGKTW